MCSLFKVSRFGFYQWKQKGKPEFNNWDLELAEKIKNLYFHYQKVYGYNMLSMLINRFYSIKINPWVVYRYMKNMKIRALIRKRNFKYREKGITSQYENIMNRNFYAAKPNQKWVTDITYILTNSKPQYLSIVRDLYNGEIIDYTLNEKNNVFLSHENIIRAWYKAGKPTNILLHSDQGFQYTVPQYKDLCKKLNIKISMSRRGNSIDNAACETWFSRFKNEVIYHIPRSKLKPSDVKNIVVNYIEFYNFVRPIKKISGMSPIEYRLNNNL